MYKLSFIKYVTRFYKNDKTLSLSLYLLHPPKTIYIEFHVLLLLSNTEVYVNIIIIVSIKYIGRESNIGENWGILANTETTQVYVVRT